jgi:hypothetical protein
MNVKPLYNAVNLPYLLFKSPKRRWNKPRTKWVRNPNEDGAGPERGAISGRKKQSSGKIL